MKLKIIISLIFGALFIWIAVTGVDFAVMGEALSSMDYGPVVPFIVLVLIYHCLRVYRWQLILRPDYPVSFRNLFSINMVGFMAINVLPARLGEFARPYLLMEREDVPLGAAMASALIERMLDFLTMLLILALVVFFVDMPTGMITVRGEEYDIMAIVQRVFLLVALPAVGGLMGLMLFEEWMYRLLHVTAGRWLPRFSQKVEGFLRAFMRSLQPLKQPKVLVIQTVLTLVIWSITPMTEWLMFRMFHLDHLGADAAITVVAAILIGMLIPAPPGFAGNFEAFTMGGLAVFGVTGGVALGYALVLHWSQFAQSFLMGMYFLYKDQISFKSLIHFSKQLKQDLRPEKGAGAPGSGGDGG